MFGETRAEFEARMLGYVRRLNEAVNKYADQKKAEGKHVKAAQVRALSVPEHLLSIRYR